MLSKIIASLLLITAVSFAQSDYKPWIKSERERHSKLIQLQKVKYPGDSKIDITYYGLDLKVTTSPDYLTGVVTIGVKTDTSELNTCFLDLRNFLAVDSILLNGVNTAFTHSNNKINITLDHNYVQNEPFTLKIYYQGVPGGTTFGGFYFNTHDGSPIISTLSESYSGPYWWPQKDTPADKADSSDMWITVDDDLIPVSNGTLESITPNGNGTHTYYWKNHHTIANYLISLAISNYTQYDTYYHYSPADSMVITNFIYPEDFNYAKPYVDETAEMIGVFADRYGEYPFLDEKYGHAEFQWGGAMEHQTCTSIGFFGSDVISHELAHQWYGDMITCKDWHHIWLNEGFATYSEAIYIEAKEGKAAYDYEMNLKMNQAKMAEGTIWVQNVFDEWEIFNWFRSYSKGACVLHMLRGIVGDSTFFQIMRAYSDNPDLKYGVATTEDFQAVAESVYGQDLGYFFQEWIYGEDEPTYAVAWNKTNIGGNIYTVDLSIYQTMNTNPLYFTMPVQIELNTSLGDTIVTLFNNAQIQNFQFQVNGNPQSLIFDPGNWILKNMTTIPVELYSFKADPINDDVFLSWTTATETNNLGFEIHRSVFGNDFSKIGFVEGHGTTTEEHNYTFTDSNLKSGKYEYRLKQIDLDGSFEYSNIVKIVIGIPNEFLLEQNYPNPFNPATKIKYSIPDNEFVILKVYDVLGNEVATLINEEQIPGAYEVTFDGKDLSSGIYFYRLESESHKDIKKMLLIK